jgi:hypothetical protein
VLQAWRFPLLLLLSDMATSMDNSVENPAIPLTPDMILGLMEELSGLDTPLVLQFCGLLANHPVTRLSRARSLGVSLPESSVVPMDLDLDPPHPPACSDDDQALNSASISEDPPSLVQDAPTISKAPQGNRGGDGVTGNRCCRGGVKRTTFSTPAKYQRKVGGQKGGGDVALGGEGVDGSGKEDMGGGGRFGGSPEVTQRPEDGLESTEDEGTASEVPGKKRKKHTRRRVKKQKKVTIDTPPAWLTDGSPPRLFAGTDMMITNLSNIISNDGLQSLADLTQSLIHPDSVISTKDQTLTLGSLIAACASEEANQTYADFRHMILLIRLAFHLER